MNKSGSVFLLAVLGPALVVAIYIAAPLLGSPDAAKSDRLAEGVERGRRLLMLYGGAEERIGAILTQLERQDVDVNLSVEDTQRLFEEHRAVVDEAEAVLKERFSGQRALSRRELEDRYQSAGGDTSQSLTPPASLGGNPGSMANAAREGVRVRDRLLAANEKILNDALREVDEALRDHTPETATGAVAEAHRLKAAIILAQANAAKRRADFTRSSVEGHRRRLMLLSGRLAEVAGERDVVRDSGILAALDGLRADVERVDEALAAAESRKRELDATISDLESRSSAARRLADDARAEMEQLRDDDVDLLAADGFESFRRAYEAASSRYEAAVAEAHRLEQGGLSNARIDDSGDFLLGDYVVGSDGGSVTRSRGLKDFRDDRETLTVDLEGLRHQESDLEASISKFEALSDDYARRAEAAAAESQAIRSEAESLFAEFDAGVNDADAAMNDAARKVNTAIASIRNASRAAGDVSRVAGDRLTAASPSRQDASPFKTLSQDKWRVGQANNELAQARITMATILTNRFLQAAADHDFVAFVKRTFELSQADVEGYAQRRNEARDSAIEEARAAASEFERSSQELRSWTVAAQAAAAHELLAILEDPAHRRTALTNYQNAVATRDALPEVRSLLDRIRQLENR